MACDPLRPTPTALFDFLKGSFETNVLGGGIVRPASPEWYVLQNDYKVFEHALSMTTRMWKETDPRYACCDNLVDMASGVDGVHPNAATFAEGYVTITGTVGAVLSSAMQVNFGGAYYRVANPSTVPAIMPVGGSITLRFRAVQPGPNASVPQATNTGLLVTPLTNIDRTVTVAGGRFCDGKLAETCEEYRTRYLARRKFRPNLNYSLLEEAALKWPCVTRICPRACCDDDVAQECGTKPLLVHAMFDTTFDYGVAPATVLDEMTDAIFGTPQGEGRGVMPIGVCGRFVPVTACVVDVVYAGLACATTAQQELIRARTATLFNNLCPGVDLCVKQFVGVAAQVVPSICDFDVTLTPRAGCAELSGCGDVLPECDVLPVLGTITLG